MNPMQPTGDPARVIYPEVTTINNHVYYQPHQNYQPAVNYSRCEQGPPHNQQTGVRRGVPLIDFPQNVYQHPVTKTASMSSLVTPCHRLTQHPRSLAPPGVLRADMSRRCASSAPRVHSVPIRRRVLPQPDTMAPESVLLRNVSVDELLEVDSPYVKKDITVVSDSVGFGFVVRGVAPTYVQTVDPYGPGYAAGLRVRQFLMMVNSVDVLNKCHQDVADLILEGPDILRLQIMQHCRDDQTGSL